MTVQYKYEREYDRRTVALLFGLSGNRCAHPDCNNPIIAEPTSFDEAAIVGHIAHIHSRSSNGPRPYPGAKPTPELVNRFDNLLLLCRHCHALIDEQENTYTAEEIARWKADHHAKHLRTRTSLLPEHHRRQLVLGIAFEVFTADATLVDVGPPVVRPALVHAPSGHTSPGSSEIRCWLQTDAGNEITLDLTNMQMPCPVGGRASILFAVSENGERQPFSLLSHSTMTWLRICDSRQFCRALTRRRVTSPPTKIANMLLCACALGAIWSLERFGFWSFVAFLVICVPFLVFEELRRQLVVQTLTRLQGAVTVS